jgi:hypothetical protein
MEPASEKFNRTLGICGQLINLSLEGIYNVGYIQPNMCRLASSSIGALTQSVRYATKHSLDKLITRATS